MGVKLAFVLLTIYALEGLGQVSPCSASNVGGSDAPSASQVANPYQGIDVDTVPTLTIMLEAAGEPLEGQVAVGEVIRNRAKARRMTWDAVCMQPKQFSAWNSREYVDARIAADDGSAYQRAARAWEMSGESNLVGGSTHYHTKSIKPYWAKGKRPAYTIGRHVFYEEIR